jgi:hypothetical protein
VRTDEQGIRNREQGRKEEVRKKSILTVEKHICA